ncbi:MAG: Na/Pi cotransporter family protein [Clostridia bacterium]|nr:Na/Pi cotransporter family protein [Clostridia bacterium]
MDAIFKVLELIGGLALFLYGMNAMGAALEKRAGNKLKIFLGNATSNPFKGFLLGLGVTLLIQSSSATTVMVVGFVNSGLMTLSNCIPVILGANLGTSVTAWILSLQAIEGGSFFLLNLLKPDAFVPVVAFIGVILFAFQKNAKRKDVGMILIGFAVLMFGMDMMSDAVSILKGNETFKSILIMFSNPILGVIVGTAFTAIIQSSSASVGVLQALSATGAVQYATAIPIIMGQNIGTCVSAMISSIGTGKNARRAAVIHLSFNIIATLIILPLFYLVDFFADFAFMDWNAGYIGIAVVHTGFKLIALAVIAPFSRGLEKLACLIVRDDKQSEEAKLLDERFFTVPSVAIDRSKTVAITMAELAVQSIHDALKLLDKYDEKEADKIREMETKVDLYEDKLGSYLVKLSSHSMTEADSAEANKLLHVIGDIERISDHAVNIVESAEEIHDKNVEFSDEARAELKIITDAVKEIIDMVLVAFRDNDLRIAFKVEPLEQVIDDLRDYMKKQHVARLRNGECTIELGFVLGDLLTNLERISDHCSNIAGCVLEIAHDELDIHKYLREVKHDEKSEFNDYFEMYKFKYSPDKN